MSKRSWLFVLTAATAAALAWGPAPCADENSGWKDTAELSFVATDGNSETSTFGFKNTLWRGWDRSSFELKAGAVRAESTKITRSAFGTSPANFAVVEDKQSETTADNAFLRGRYDRKITDRFFWFAGAGWDRNRPAGINNRYTGFGGVGNIWVDRDTVKFRTDYSATFTSQDDVVEAPGVDDSFLGARFSWTYWHQFGENTTYGNDFVVDENLNETSDFRADMTNWVQVSMNARLALKVSLQWLYDNEPAFVSLPLNNTAPPPATLGNVFVELDELDTIFTTSLVINF